MKATLAHARQLGYCSEGLRDWCKSNNMEFLVLVREGFDCDVLRATRDHLALAMVELAEQEALENGT